MEAGEYSNIRPNFPAQKKKIRQKGEKFIQECTDAAINLTIYNPDVRLRANKRNVKANYNLVNGIIDMQDVEETINPFGFDMKQFPNAFNHYPIINNKINVLVGEEASMMFPWRVKVVNDDAVSDKEKFIKQSIIDELMQIALANIPEEKKEEVAKVKAAELQRWAKYEAQDIRERIGTQILKHLWQEQRLKLKFNQGFKDWLIAGEEIYHIGVYGNKPSVRKCEPLSIWTVGMGNSSYIQDAEIIVEDTYQPPGWIIDHFYDELTPAQIDSIEKGLLLSTPANSSGIVNYPPQDFTANFLLGSTATDGLFDSSPIMLGGTGSIYDADGNLRTTMVTWRSRRLIKVVESFDEYGYKVREIYDELTKFPKELGMNVKELWVNEWWQSTRVGQDIYLKGGPVPYQARYLDNLSMSRCPYVGTICNTSLSKARSLVDVMKPYNYAYDTISYRLDKAMARYKGPMIEMDMAKMPEGWHAEKWLYIAEESGYMYVDSFKEGQKGSAKGVLAGIYNTTGKILNPEMGTYIRDLRDHLMFIQSELDTISGITRQREGAIDNRETVGGVERSVTQSSHSTRELFYVHEQTKLAVLETLLDVAKGVYVDDNIILQYISDSDLAQEIYRIDGRMFREADYGLVATDGAQYTDMKNNLIQLAQAGLQNGLLTFSKLIDIMMSDDVASTRRKIEQYEAEAEANKQQAEEAQRKHEAELLQMKISREEDAQSHDIEKLLVQRETQLLLKDLEISNAPEEVDNTSEELAAQERIKDKEIASKERIAAKDLALKEKIAMAQEETKKKIASLKPKTTKK